MKLFHGTSYKRFKEMQESGFLGGCKPIWSCSEEDTTYFWNEEFLIKNNDLHDIEGHIDDLVIYEGIRNACESAEMVLAQEKVNLRRVILMLDSEDLDPSYLTQDESCGEGMMHCSQYSQPIPLDLVKKIWVDPEPLDLFAIFFIGNALVRNEQEHEARGRATYILDLGENCNLSYSLQEACKKFYFSMAESWLEDVSYNYEPVEYYLGENATLINSYSHYQLLVN